MRQMNLLSFAYSQLLFAVTVCLGYLYFFQTRIFSKKGKAYPVEIDGLGDLLFRPRLFFSMLRAPGATVAKTTFSYSVSFFFQGIYKHILTEGEKFILFAFVSSLSDQGVFGLVSNLGSIVARLLLQPVEETSFAIFSKLQARAKSSSDHGSSSGKTKCDLFDPLPPCLDISSKCN